MMFRKILATMGLLLSISFSANAALITVERADAVLGTANLDLAGYWASLSSADITSEMIQTATMLYNGSANNNTIFKMTIDVPNSVDVLFSLFAGLDAGRGAEVFVNGNLIADVNSNIWWSRSWSHSSVIAAENLNFLANQMNQIVIYWAENGNSGGNSFEFMVDGGPRLALSQDNLYSAVPAPSTIALFGLALIGLGLSRRNAK